MQPHESNIILKLRTRFIHCRCRHLQATKNEFNPTSLLHVDNFAFFLDPWPLRICLVVPIFGHIVLFWGIRSEKYISD